MNLQTINLIKLQIREKKLQDSADKRKYNVGYLRRVEDITDTTASDERSGADTGSELSRTNFNE